MDLKLGCAFTRFQTKFFQGKYGDLDTNLVSYGPCQTPTLWFCVQRSDEINTFQPKTYYTVDVTLSKAGRELALQWDREQTFDMGACKKSMSLVQEDQAKAVVTDVTQKEDRMARPQALNTVAMLKMASTRLGLGPQQALHLAERLYLDGYLTYPRTETNTYPKNFDLQGAVRAQTGHPVWGSYSNDLLSGGLARPREGVDMGDHPPITPVRAATEGQLGDAYRLYDMITRHFLATVSRDCKFQKIRVNFNINGEGFSISGRKVIDPGFTAIQRSGEMEDVVIPDFQKGEAVDIRKVSMGTGKTRPPPYLSESDLLSLMEKHGIGTDASMATHINNICERNYVQLAEGRRLIPTQLGIALVHGYEKVDNELVIPKVRANMEAMCTKVAEGRAEKWRVIQDGLRLFKEKFIYYVKNVDIVDQLFQCIFTPLEASGRPLSRCGDCQRYLAVVDRKPVRMFCKTCNRIFKMPQNGQMKLYKELKCPLDNFELVFVANKVGKSYPICPKCYDTPPYGEKEEQGKHWNLDHPIYKKYRPAVMDCFADHCSGTLCLDVDSGPKWQMDCNVCLQQLSIFEDKAHKIKATSDYCEECSSVLLEVVFNKGKSPLPDGQLEMKGCLVCDEVFSAHAVSKTGKNFFRRSPGKGKVRTNASLLVTRASLLGRRASLLVAFCYL
ncbi:DNA topoisomerase 3-beta-1 (DNA topoisomerase III beta-1) [Durusdinium trenchii]|uniref:DNA topoisomerase n=1 Tax=Durusdinium trenchii TaxID=1381693 RepID=A0ABP0PTB5_9DINO